MAKDRPEPELLVWDMYKFLYMDKLKCTKEDVEDNVDLRCLKEAVARALSTLSPQEEKVLRMRFGFDDDYDCTYKEVAKSFELSGTRIRQIEAKALRKLRHRCRAKKLKEFVYGYKEQVVSDTTAAKLHEILNPVKKEVVKPASDKPAVVRNRLQVNEKLHGILLALARDKKLMYYGDLCVELGTNIHALMVDLYLIGSYNFEDKEPILPVLVVEADNLPGDRVAGWASVFYRMKDRAFVTYCERIRGKEEFVGLSDFEIWAMHEQRSVFWHKWNR